MIYDKPRDLSLRLRDVIFNKKHYTKSSKSQKLNTDNQIVKSSSGAEIKAPPVVMDKRADKNEANSLKGKKEPIKTEDKVKKDKTFRAPIVPVKSEVIDLETLPDIEGIPLLALPPLTADQRAFAEKKEAEKLLRIEKEKEKFLILQEAKEKALEEKRLKEIELKKVKEETQLPTAPPFVESEMLKEEKEKKLLKEEQKEKDFEPDFFPKEPEGKAEASEIIITKSKAEYKNELIKKSKAQRKEQEALSVKASAKGKNKTNFIKIASFFLVLYMGTIVSFIIPLRPTYSESEKRNLKEFPKFSAQSFFKGDYFEDIGTWFSDTFPFREAFTKANTFLKSLSGFDSVEIHGDVDTGDDIPDLPLPDVSQTPETTLPPVTKPAKPKPPKMPTDDDLQDAGNPNAQRPNFGTQSLGAIIVANDSAYEYYTFSQSLAPRYINALSSIKSKAKPTGNVYTVIAPTSIDITLNDALRSDIRSANQEKALNYFNASIKNTVNCKGVYEAERLHRNEYTYFRTDHHWTALGAYYAYEEFAKEKGVEPIPLSKYETKTFNGFLGTFYSGSGQASKLANNPDFVKAYLPFNDVSCTIKESSGKEYDWKVISDVESYGKGLKYLTFIGGDNALTTITNNDNPEGETCIVIKESYGNAFTPFLIPHYHRIYVIDPRHFNGTLSDFVANKSIDDVLFVGNISSTRNDVFITALESLLK